MHATLSPEATLCTVRTNRFGGYAPVLHRRGTAAPKQPTSGIAFPTIGEAVTYAQETYGVSLVAVPGNRHPSGPLRAA